MYLKQTKSLNQCSSFHYEENSASEAVPICKVEADATRSSSPHMGSSHSQSHRLQPLKRDGPKQSSIEARLHDGWLSPIHTEWLIMLITQCVIGLQEYLINGLTKHMLQWKTEICLHTGIKVKWLQILSWWGNSGPVDPCKKTKGGVRICPSGLHVLCGLVEGGWWFGSMVVLLAASTLKHVFSVCWTPSDLCGRCIRP